MQANWIGKSQGAIIKFKVKEVEGLEVPVYTTRPDTVYGITYLVVAPEYKDIEKLLKEHPQNLHFTGLVERDKMPQVYQMGDVMLLPSFDELFPMTVLEAMSCHVPILLRDLDLYPVILDGYYLKAQDNAGFAEELNKLSQQPQYYEQAVQMSRKGNDFYSEEHVLSMWRDFYHGLLGESQRRQNKPILKKVFSTAVGGVR